MYDNIAFLNKEERKKIKEIKFGNLNFNKDLICLENAGLKVTQQDINNLNLEKWLQYVKLLKDKGIKKILFLDFETTTLNGNAISMGVVIYSLRERKFIEEKYLTFNPLTKINKEASKIHKIYDKDIENSPTFKDQINYIKKIINETDIVIAFNAIYDISVIVREFERAGELLPKLYFLDLMNRTKNIVNARNSLGRIKNPSLNEFVSYVGIKVSEGELHNALYDTKIMAKAFDVFVGRYYI